MPSTSIILVIDTGSSSVRCTAYKLKDDPPKDGSSSIIAIGISHSIPLSSVIPSTGYIRVNETLMSIDDCIDNVLSSLRPSISDYQVVAVGFSTFVVNLIGVNEMGEPVDEVATCSYACNRRDVVEECQSLKQKMSSEQLKTLYQQTGAPLHSAYALPQLLALYNNVENRSIFSKIHKWQTISSLCLHRWMGGGKIQVPISFSEASWTGMLNFETCRWNQTMIHILDSCDAIQSSGGILNLLPPLVDFDGTTGDRTASSILCNGISPLCSNGEINQYWKKWPELRGADIKNHVDFSATTQFCRLFLGLGDGAAANCGSKCGAYSTNVQRIAVTIGTSAAARVCLPLRLQAVPLNLVDIPHGLFCYRVDRNCVLIGGALTDGGSVIEWVRNLLNLQSGEAFDGALEEVSKQYHNNKSILSVDSMHEFRGGAVTVIPFLSGERSTGFRDSASACIAGITRDTTPADVLYGCLEGVTLRLGAVIDLISTVCRDKQWKTSGDDEGHQPIIVVSGNALEQSIIWRQMIADCTGFGVVVDSDSTEGTSRGVAMLLARTIQDIGQREEKISILSESRPIGETKSKWDYASLNQEDLIQAVSITWNR